MTTTPASPEPATQSLSPETSPEIPDTPTAPAKPWRTLTASVLARRSTAGSQAYRAAMRTACHPATETGAYLYTEGPLATLPPHLRVGARRAAGICAANPDVPHDPTQRLGTALGTWYRRTHEPLRLTDATPTAYTQQLAALPLLDVETTAATLALFIGRLSGTGIGLNYHNLADTLTWWGNGTDPRSRQLRQDLLADFYAAAT